VGPGGGRGRRAPGSARGALPGRAPGRGPPLVQVPIPFSRALHEWGLERFEHRDAPLMLTRPLRPQSVSRGRVERPDGLPLVDQCY
jgi:hypothetical protein